MKKTILLAITLIFLSYGSIVCAQGIPANGGVSLCPMNPYRFSQVHPDPDFIYLNSPANTISQSWFQVQWINNGSLTAYNVTAKISCYPPGITSTDPMVTLGNIGPGESVWSTDDFDQIIDSTAYTSACTLIDPVTHQYQCGVCWEVSYQDVLGNQYVITDIAKFCGEDCCFICDCTVIELDSFTALAGNKNVAITWQTAAEKNNIGFNIYRAETKDGTYVKINTELIPSQGSPFQGMKYTFVDTTAKNRKTYYYKLEDIDVSDTATLHGPYSATPRLIFGLFKK